MQLEIILPVHRKRLEKLAKYLLTLSPEYNVTHFKMSRFFKHNNDGLVFPSKTIDIFKTHLCGTTACALGHAPVVFPALIKKYEKETSWIGASGYWRSLGGYLFNIDMDNGPNTDLWEFLFSSDWEYNNQFLFCSDWEDNDQRTYYMTSWAVADRIAHLLSGKMYPGWVNKFERMACAKFASAEAGWISEEELRDNEKKFVKLYNENLEHA